jgi:hypothetical protein
MWKCNDALTTLYPDSSGEGEGTKAICSNYSEFVQYPSKTSEFPHRSPHRKSSSADIEAILELRQKNKSGPRRLQNKLYREQGTKYLLATTHKVLKAL